MHTWMLILNIFSVIDGEEGTIRACGYKLPETCSIQEIVEGTTVTICNCDTDNCNKDNQCDCSSNPTTQGPATQTTTTSSSTTIGISVLALLVSAFFLSRWNDFFPFYQFVHLHLFFDIKVLLLCPFTYLNNEVNSINAT